MPTESFQCKEMLTSIKLATFFLTKVFLPIDGFLFGSNVVYNDVCKQKKEKEGSTISGNSDMVAEKCKIFWKEKIITKLQK